MFWICTSFSLIIWCLIGFPDGPCVAAAVALTTVWWTSLSLCDAKFDSLNDEHPDSSLNAFFLPDLSYRRHRSQNMWFLTESNLTHGYVVFHDVWKLYVFFDLGLGSSVDSFVVGLSLRVKYPNNPLACAMFTFELQSVTPTHFWNCLEGSLYSGRPIERPSVRLYRSGV